MLISCCNVYWEQQLIEIRKTSPFVPDLNETFPGSRQKSQQSKLLDGLGFFAHNNPTIFIHSLNLKIH